MTDQSAPFETPDLSWFRVSENGNGVGLTILNDGTSSSSLIIHVLPKLWRPPGVPRRRVVPLEGGAVDVYEGDAVAFPRIWAERMESVAPPSGESDDGPMRAYPDAEDMEPGAGDQLWAPLARPLREGTDPMPPPEPLQRSAMWDLLLRHHLQVAPVRGSLSDFGAAAGAFAAMPELRPLLQSVFVDRAVALIPSRKPTYREIVEPLGVVRGRILPTPLMRREATRSVRIECEFDLLTTDDDLWRAVKAALTACSEAVGRTDLARAAISRLHDVGDERPASVLSRTRHRRVRNDPASAELLDLALAVLRGDAAHSGESPRSSGVAINVKFVTSDLWEYLLTHAFRGTGADVVKRRMPLFFRRADDDWRASTGKAPDLVITPVGGRTVVVDAKYMNSRSLASVSMGAQYQISTYALRSGAPSFLAFCAAPGEETTFADDAEVTLVPALWDEWEQRTLPASSPPPCVVVGSFRFAFPSPGDSSYAATLQKQARDLLAFVETARADRVETAAPTDA